MKIITRFVLTFLLLILSFSSALAQTNNSSNTVIDSFGDHKLPGWVWGGNLTMKYSFPNDNPENGYGVISSTTQVTANSFVGLVRKEQKIQFAQDNILSVMLQGVSNDLYATVQILYDNDKDNKYDEVNDTRLESKPISLNFSGWKEFFININDNDLKIVSKNKNEDFSILESEAYAIQISYQAGKDFKSSTPETGVALITLRPNKQTKQEIANSSDNTGTTESFFSLKNYPNPFNPETTISYTLKSASNVTITVYDRLGREVAVLLDGSQSEGDHTISFNASNLPSGVYFYRVKTPDKTEVQKMVLAK